MYRCQAQLQIHHLLQQLFLHQQIHNYLHHTHSFLPWSCQSLICSRNTTVAHNATICKEEEINQWVANMEISIKDLRSSVDRQTVIVSTLHHSDNHIPNTDDEVITPDKFNETVPIQYCLTSDRLEGMQSQAKWSRNFDLKLVVKFFPELFGPENLHCYFSFIGGGPKYKRGLDDTRKLVLKMHPILLSVFDRR